MTAPALRQAVTRRGRSFATVECPCVGDSALRPHEACDETGEVEVEIDPACGGVVPDEERFPALERCGCEDAQETQETREVA